MDDIVRHKTLILLSKAVYERVNEVDIALPPTREEALNTAAINSLDLYGTKNSSYQYFPNSLHECLTSISDDDYLLVSDYVDSLGKNRFNLATIDNLVFSGGGGKGAAYASLIEHLSESNIYVFKPSEVASYLERDYGIILDQDSLIHTGKVTESEFKKELESGLISAGFAPEVHTELTTQMILSAPVTKSSTLKELKAVSGTSAGAITALPIALGMNYDEYKDIITQNQFNHFFMSNNSTGAFSKLYTHAMQDKYGIKYIDKFSKNYTRNLAIELHKAIAASKDPELSIARNIALSDKGNLPIQSFEYLIEQCNQHKIKTGNGILDNAFMSTMEQLNAQITEAPNSRLAKSYAAFVEQGGFKHSLADRNEILALPEAVDAFYISLYRSNNIDAISEFFGNMIVKKAESIGVHKLKEALPERYEKDYTGVMDLAQKLILEAGEAIEARGETLNSQLILGEVFKIDPYSAKNPKDAEGNLFVYLTSEGAAIPADLVSRAQNLLELYHQDKVMHQKDECVDIESVYYELKNNKELSSRFDSRSAVVEGYLQDSFYKSMNDLTFNELNKIKSKIPESGIKDIYITATEVRLTRGVVRTRYFGQDQGIDKKDAAKMDNKDLPIGDAPIKQAIRASMGVPVVFKAKKYTSAGGNYLYDGGLRANTPAKPFKGKHNTAFAIVGDQNFYDKKKTLSGSWKGKLLSKSFMGSLISRGMYAGNDFQKNFSTSSSLKSIFLNSEAVGMMNFNFSGHLDSMGDTNKSNITSEPNLDKDGYYYYLKNKQDNLGSEINFTGELYPGIFSDGSYGTEMKKMMMNNDGEVSHGL